MRTAPALAVALAGLALLPGCHVVAGLDEEHELRLSRWPDSATSFCANEADTITCPAAQQPFHGQDCCYSINTPEYQDKGGDVHDTLTGLDWRKHPDPKLTWEEAVGGCAGFGDGFRLPSRLELVSLADYGRTPPKLGPAALLNVPPEYHWTSSSDAGMVDAWGVHMGCGPSSCESPTLSPSPLEFKTTTRLYHQEQHPALCVRGEPLFDKPPPPGPPMTGAMSIEYKDDRTGLTWSVGSRIGSFQKALEMCENLVEGGAEDWRLPNIKELQTLVNEMPPEPMQFLPFGESDLTLWSSTPYVGAPGLAHALFSNGGTAFVDMMSRDYYGVACVRGPYAPQEGGGD